jgi:alanine racemase
MVDVTDIPSVRRGDTVTLIGRDGDQEVTAEEMATWSDTINYEIVSRIALHITRYPT